MQANLNLFFCPLYNCGNIYQCSSKVFFWCFIFFKHSKNMNSMEPTKLSGSILVNTEQLPLSWQGCTMTQHESTLRFEEGLQALVLHLAHALGALHAILYKGGITDMDGHHQPPWLGKWRQNHVRPGQPESWVTRCEISHHSWYRRSDNISVSEPWRSALHKV